MLEWLVVKIDELLAISVRIAVALEGLTPGRVKLRTERGLLARSALAKLVVTYRMVPAGVLRLTHGRERGIYGDFIGMIRF